MNPAYATADSPSRGVMGRESLRQKIERYRTDLEPTVEVDLTERTAIDVGFDKFKADYGPFADVVAQAVGYKSPKPPEVKKARFAVQKVIQAPNVVRLMELSRLNLLELVAKHVQSEPKESEGDDVVVLTHLYLKEEFAASDAYHQTQPRKRISQEFVEVPPRPGADWVDVFSHIAAGQVIFTSVSGSKDQARWGR
jgi:hypothetical protein